MFDPNKWFAVVSYRAVIATGISKDQVLSRICSPKTFQHRCEDWNDQPAVLIDDGRVKWKVTFSDELAPDGEKRMAFVVDGQRYGDEFKNNDAPSQGRDFESVFARLRAGKKECV